MQARRSRFRKERESWLRACMGSLPKSLLLQGWRSCHRQLCQPTPVSKILLQQFFSAGSQVYVEERPFQGRVKVPSSPDAALKGPLFHVLLRCLIQVGGEIASLIVARPVIFARSGSSVISIDFRCSNQDRSHRGCPP